MSSLRFVRVRFSHSDAITLIEDASFHLAHGWTGLVGPNGSGKTTLLRLLAGQLEPRAGQVVREPADATTLLCPQLCPDTPATLGDLAHSSDPLGCRLRGQLGLEPAALARWSTCSPGERKRWQIGAALLADPDVLLLDEPTNHLDAEARALLVDALSVFGGVGVVVSHDRALLEALTRRTLRVDGGSVRLWPGAYRAASLEWEREEHQLRDERDRDAAEARGAARRLGEAHRRHRAAQASLVTRHRMKGVHDHDARGALAKGRAENAERTLGRQVGVARRRAERADAAASAIEVAEPLGRSVFVGYERAERPRLLGFDGHLNIGGRRLLSDVHVALMRDGRVHLAGKNGSGKTSLVRAMLDRAALPANKVLFLPQELGAEAARDLLDSVRRLAPAERGRVLSLVAALGADPSQLLASAQPSPGEARKLGIALGLGRHVWALVLDEPTNHLDLPSVERLEAALAEFPGALLLVTHDEALAARCTTERWRIDGGRVEL